jgi:hypothetical protein
LVAFGLLSILRDFLKKISLLERQGPASNERILKGAARKALVVLTVVATIPVIVFRHPMLLLIPLFTLPLLATAYFMACVPPVRRHSEPELDFRRLGDV